MSGPPISAADGPSPEGATPAAETRAPLPPCLLVDVLWESFAASGAAALAAGPREPARAAWRTAVRLAAAFAPADPRRAASLGAAAALGAVDAAGGAVREADLRAAVAAWRLVPLWVAGMRVERKPRSSLFHQRMERRHAVAYDEAARAGYRRLAEGGLAAALANLAELLRTQRRTAQAEAFYREAIAARRSALGGRDAALAGLLDRLAALRAPADPEEAHRLAGEAAAILRNGPVEPLERWARDRPARMSDLRRLLAAVYLAPVIPEGRRA